MAKNPEHVDESDSDTSDNESSQETGSQESDDSDSEPELTQSTKKPTPAAAKKPPHPSASKPQQPPPTSSTEDEESGSDSESDSDGPVESTPAPKEEPQKPTNGAKKSKKSSAADPVTPIRPAEEKETEAKDVKKSRKKAEPESSDTKSTETPKKSSQRVWSEEDETVILKGMIDYSAKKKTDPTADINAFHDFINKDLHRKDSAKSQLQDKIRRLKKKYETYSNKEKSGKEMTFSSAHEQKAYELSKSVWGNKNVKENGVEKAAGTPKPKPKDSSKRKAAIKRTFASDKEEAKEAKAVGAVDAETESLLPAKRVKTIGETMEERVLAIGAELFANGKGGALAKEWNKLRLDELQVYLRQLEVKTAQARVVVERLKSEEM